MYNGFWALKALRDRMHSVVASLRTRLRWIRPTVTTILRSSISERVADGASQYLHVYVSTSLSLSLSLSVCVCVFRFSLRSEAETPLLRFVVDFIFLLSGFALAPVLLPCGSSEAPYSKCLSGQNSVLEK